MIIPSPYIQALLDRNHIELIEVLRYGPRFASLKVSYHGETGFFKCSLPRAEQELFRPSDYGWSIHDNEAELDRRILREAHVLDHLARSSDYNFEPRVIAISSDGPAWSVRTFVEDNNFAQGESTFAFADHFFTQVEPEQIVDLFANIQRHTATVPAHIDQLIDLADLRKLAYSPHMQHALDYAQSLPFLSANDKVIVEHILSSAWRHYNPKTFVLTHGEAFPPHFVRGEHGELGLIDWENASYDDALYDFSVVYKRVFSDPAWQEKFVAILRHRGYFEGTGRKRWQAELLTQSLLNHRYVSGDGSFGNEAYDTRALAFFEATIRAAIDAEITEQGGSKENPPRVEG
jgi:aminoglycoside phosphotransferase (APT) family kinase protein